MDMTDVRKALWRAYGIATTFPDYMGKSSEAFCEARYPNFFAVDGEEQFIVPEEIMVYSYALGPSRQHWFYKAKVDRQVDERTWESPNPCAKAVEVIESWLKEFIEFQEEETGYRLTEAGRAMLRDAQQSSPDRQQGE